MRRKLVWGGVLAIVGSIVFAGLAQSHNWNGPPPDPNTRGDRYVPKPPGTKSKYNFFFGPYVVPPGHDMNRVDVDVPLANGLVTSVEPARRSTPRR